ncbi:MAG: tRNA dihydrouridine synthase DusB [Clostridia bacterium]|nr:tRNA dihydrouridine synthase DusB [Clostridia bacterium]
MKIGNVEIQNNIFLAPMAGITDLPFRILCKEHGAGLVYTEMVSSKGIFYDDSKTKRLMSIDERERPAAIQIFGSDAEIMSEMAEKISEEADIIDINMGCPAPKVIKNLDGSKLMLYPEKIDEITKKVVEKAKVPVTIKIRKGWDDEHVNAVEVAQIAEKNGISAITVHGRTREQFYTGTADLEIIKKVKEAVKIPVIGNGDITNGETAKRMFETTGCDAIMIGRGSNGNPWIFEEITKYLTNDTSYQKPTIEEIKQMINKHLDMLCEHKGEYTAIREMRKQIAWYVKGLPGATQIRNEINKIEEIESLRKKIEEI